jgi:hypothetical protein
MMRMVFTTSLGPDPGGRDDNVTGPRALVTRAP